jgi:TP901 family phage tail tape measure protein
MLGPVAASQKTFASFELSMAKVRAIITPTTAEFTAMWRQAKMLGETTQFTATDAARAMAVFAQANFKTNQIMAAMPATLDLAAAGEMDVAEAADIAAQIMNSMGIEADDVGKAIDVLTKATQTANTDLRQLGHAFTYAGAIASSAGVNFEEATVFLQMMSNAGIKADMAGTTLRGALLALTSPSQMAKERLNELGIDVDTVKGDFASLSEVIRQFESRMKSMGTADRMKFLGDIFDNRQASGFAKAVANGAEMFVKMEKTLYDSTGSARKFAQTLMGTVSGSWLYLTSAIEGLQISLGSMNASLTQGLLGVLTELVGRIMNWVEANRSTVQSIIIIAGAVGTAGVSLLALSIAIQAIVVALSPLSMLIGLVTGAFGILSGAVSFLMTPLGMLTAAFAIVMLSFNDIHVELNNLSALTSQWGNYMISVFRYTSEGIADAISAGDMGLAWGITLAGMKLALINTMDSISQIFSMSTGEMIAALQRLYKFFGTIVMYYREFNNAGSNIMAALIARPGVDIRPEVLDGPRAQLDAAWASLDAVDPSGTQQAIDNAMVDTAAKSLAELVALREEARLQREIADETRQKMPELGAARTPPEARMPDTPGMSKPADEAVKSMERAIAFASIGSFGGRLLDRMGPGPQVMDKIQDNTKKMVQEQQETNDHLANMDGPVFGP